MADIEKHEAAPIEEAQKDLKKQAVDTTHTDEAMKVLVNYEGEETWTQQEEKKVLRKIDRRLLSLLICTYGLQYYDKAMLSQAVSLDNSPMWSSSLTVAGIVRSQRRSATEHRYTIFLLIGHILSRLHSRGISCDPDGSEISNRTSSSWHCIRVGHLSDLHLCMPQL